MLNNLSTASLYLATALKCLQHLIIPIGCLVMIIVLHRKQVLHKKTTAIFSAILIILTVFSYFIGIYSSTKITHQSFSPSKQSNYFYIESQDNSFTYCGKIIVCKKDELKSYTEVFDDEELFDVGLSQIGKYILKNNIGIDKKIVGNENITFSATVLCEDNFMAGRNNYAGYIIIENTAKNDEIIFIPYQLNFQESLNNDITFAEIYSSKYSISIKEIFDNIVTEKQYTDYRYS